jgi:hypothetical protein
VSFPQGKRQDAGQIALLESKRRNIMGSFGLNTNTREFLPYIKLNCKDGIVERSTFNGTERGTEIIENLVALFDFATIQVGWMRFEGEAPDMRLVAIGDPLPDRPGEDYKQGVKIVVMLPGELGLHEISTTATAALGALEQIHDEAIAAPEWAAGQVPAVQLTDWTGEKGKFGTRAIPTFRIVGWKDRTDALAKHKAIPKQRAAMPGAGTRPAVTGSKPMTPSPAPPQPKAPPVVDLEDFG